MKVYEVIAQGAVDGGYIYAEKTIGIFSTLERAVEFAKSRPLNDHDLWDDENDYLYLDSVSHYAVFRREIDCRLSDHDEVFRVGADEATVHPVYDALGYDSGLWRCVHEDEYGADTYDMLDIRVSSRDGRTVLNVYQYPDWDGESYHEDGSIDAKCVKLGTLECANPFDDPDAASVLFEWLCWNRRAERAE